MDPPKVTHTRSDVVEAALRGGILHIVKWLGVYALHKRTLCGAPRGGDTKYVWSDYSPPDRGHLLCPTCVQAGLSSGDLTPGWYRTWTRSGGG